MSDIRQSTEYANFIRSLGWKVEKVGEWNTFIKPFSIFGSLIKIQRIIAPIPFDKIEALAKKHRAFQIILEPISDSVIARSETTKQSQYLKYKPLKSPFIPTKTLILDLKRTEKEIFDSFSKNKRRDIRIAERNNLVIKEGTPEDFYLLKKKHLLKRGILPFGTKNEIFPLVKAFGPEKSKILIALPNTPNIPKIPNSPVAGTILLFHDKIAYYWQAAATDQGKKLMAPTLLVWEAIKLAKKKGCIKFDFEGIFDDRFPENKSWQGFTHFKQGFNGEEIIYPEPITKTKFRIF